MNIVGRPDVSKDQIVVVGGIEFKKGIPGNCHLQHLTLRQAKGNGVYGESSFTMEDVLVEQCGYYGVVAGGTDVVVRCTNVEVRQCQGSGVVAEYGASITLIGAKTTVHHNCTKGEEDEYGLQVDWHRSTIQLVAPLTKEQVSIDNGGDGNWGAYWGARITQIKTIVPALEAKIETKPQNIINIDILRNLPTFMQRQILSFFGYKDFTLASRTCKYLNALRQEAINNNRLPLFVPMDCNTLQEAVDRVHKDFCLTTILLMKGEHEMNGTYLEIPSAMNIVGDPSVLRENIVVVGGIWFEKGIQGNCHLQHLTLRQAKRDGVFGQSSFTMEEVLLEQCGYYGVVAEGTGVVGRCTNVEVRQCGFSGVVAAFGASITLIGAKTTVHHNCTTGGSDKFGLGVYGSSSSTIQLVSPLTKEQVSLDNSGGGNWGARWGAYIHQIISVVPAL